MLRLFAYLAIVGVAAGIASLVVTRPQAILEAEIAGIAPDLARGEEVFHASGCASCHAAKGAEAEARLILAGGATFETPAGTFVAPNISQHPEAGIGGWSRAEIVTAVINGTSPGGAHYYPAFPYGSYAKAELADIVSLAAFLETLPEDATPSAPHDLRFPFTIRAGIGLWKAAAVSDAWVIDARGDETLARGRYLVEALGHCGECHTPRTATQGLDTTRWLAGAPNPSGRGTIPNITPGALDWTVDDLVAYLTTGFTPDFDVVGGSMASVVQNLAMLPASDIQAIAAYLKAVPPVE